MSARERDAALSAGVLAFAVLEWVKQRYDLPPIDLIEPVIGCVEHEPARDPDGNADRAPVEFDGKTLANHWTLLLATRGLRRLATLASTRSSFE